MKAKAHSDPEPFAPITVDLLFETKEELESFYAIFNYTPVCLAVRCLRPNVIRNVISNLMTNSTNQKIVRSNLAAPYLALQAERHKS